MNRLIFWTPLALLGVIVAGVGLRYGYLAANLTETDAIELYAARYVASVDGGVRTDCHARPGDAVGEWLIIACRAPDASLHLHYVNRFGGLSHFAVMRPDDVRRPTREAPRT